jgi:hypothetical protein
MGSAIERLKALAASPATPLPALDRRILAETGLPTVIEPDLDPAQAAIEAELGPLVEAGNFAAVALAFDHLFSARTLCGNGYRGYRVAQSILLSPIELAADDGDAAAGAIALKAYRRWWMRDRTDPAAAAIYARALVTDQYPSRESADLSEKVLIAALRTNCREARRALAYAGPNGRKHWLWRQADFTVTFAAWSCGIEDEDLLRPSFLAVQKLDPHEFSIYDDRAVHLLPQWGGSLAAVDRLARSAADRTRAQFGDLLYARIYDTVLDFQDPETTKVDPERLLAAFSEWYARFPSQALANRYAAHAHTFGDTATLRQLFRSAIREIQPEHWFDNEQPIAAWRAAIKKRSGKI